MGRRCAVKLAGLVVLLLFAGTGRVVAQPPTITVYAAADLAFAFQDIAPLFYDMHDVARVRRWQVSVHKGAIQVLPSVEPEPTPPGVEP
jgi:ABC-type molybdate transport system substrate-binding protein